MHWIHILWKCNICRLPDEWWQPHWHVFGTGKSAMQMQEIFLITKHIISRNTKDKTVTFFQFVPKLTTGYMNEIEKILCNRPVHVREHMQRWLDSGSGGHGSPGGRGADRGGGLGTSGGTSTGGTSSGTTSHREGTSSTHVIPAHTTMPKHGKIDPNTANAATPGCNLQWPLLANELDPWLMLFAQWTSHRNLTSKFVLQVI